MRNKNKILNELVNKYHKPYLKKYLEQNALNISKYPYQEVLYVVPILAFIYNRLWIKNIKGTQKLFNESNLHKIFYDFYFSEDTQNKINEIISLKHGKDIYKEKLLQLFSNIAVKMGKKIYIDFKTMKKMTEIKVLWEFISVLSSYFFTDDLIGEFDKSIDKMLANKYEYERNVSLFSIKLEYLKQIHNFVLNMSPDSYNDVLVAINLVTKSHF